MIDVASFEVSRKDLRQTRLVREPIDTAEAAARGAVVLAIDHFALTANNITYGAYGDEMAYWAFFPAGDGFGRIPVWGFADVVASGHPEIAVGERIYGYLPMASHLVVEPVKFKPGRFVDGAAHRAELPAVYNVYQRLAADPTWQRGEEERAMLLKPLAITSFLIADFLDDNAVFGARRVVVSSASSKTSLGLGYCLKQLARPGLETIGLTSSGNAGFVAGTGLFDHTVTYDAITGLDAAVPTVFVDMAGSVDIITRVHNHLGATLVYSCRVGATHWQDRAHRLDLPGARPVFFFAPKQIEKRNADWGPGGLETRFAAAFAGFARGSVGWLKIEHGRGEAALEAAYAETVAGRVHPSRGLVLSLGG